jgi:hypothetical protein
MAFIETLKERVIRYLPELNEVKIILGVFDKNNMFHRLVIGAYYLISKMLNRENKKNFYKTIIGDICFNNID